VCVTWIVLTQVKWIISVKLSQNWGFKCLEKLVVSYRNEGQNEGREEKRKERGGSLKGSFCVSFVSLYLTIFMTLLRLFFTVLLAALHMSL
jgi:hypothetical protein